MKLLMARTLATLKAGLKLFINKPTIKTTSLSMFSNQKHEIMRKLHHACKQITH